MLHFTRFAWLASLPCAALMATCGRALFADAGKRTWIFLAGFGGGWGALAAFAYRLALDDGQKAVIGGQTLEAVVLFGVLFALLAGLTALARRAGEASRPFRGALAITIGIDLAITFVHEANMSRPFFEPIEDFAYPAEDQEAARAVSEPARMFRVFREPVVKNIKVYSQYTVNDRWITLGAYSSSGYDNGAPPRIIQLYTALQGAKPSSRIFERVIKPMASRTSEITSTAIVLTEDHTLRRVHAPLPRVKLFARYRAEPDDLTVVRALYDPGYDLASSLLVHDAPSFPSADAEARGEVAIVEDDFDRVTLQVRAEQASLVLLNDTFSGGWRVEVDGKPGKILRANYAFRAVEVPAGRALRAVAVSSERARGGDRDEPRRGGSAGGAGGVGGGEAAAGAAAGCRRRRVDAQWLSSKTASQKYFAVPGAGGTRTAM